MDNSDGTTVRPTSLRLTVGTTPRGASGREWEHSFRSGRGGITLEKGGTDLGL